MSSTPMILRAAAVATLAAMLAIGVARATEGPSSEDGRYIVRKAEDGWFRIDQNTGQASLCKAGEVGFVCELVPDDRDALLDEITRLAEENAMLRARIDRAETEGGAEQSGEPGLDLPSEEDVDRMMSQFRVLVDRFLQTIQELHEEYTQPEQQVQ